MKKYPLKHRSDSEALTDVSYWKGRQAGLNPDECAPDDRLMEKEWFNLVRPHLEPYQGQRLLELGCYPGHISAFMCRRIPFEPAGIDFSPLSDKYLEILKAQGISNATLFKEDIRSFKPDLPYDVVCSFGLIEHFRDTQSILDHHNRILRPGGLCVVIIPNFRKIQYLYHAVFDGQDLVKHNIEAMNTMIFSNFARRNRHIILCLEYAGNLRFWNVDLTGSSLRSGIKRICSKIVRETARLIGKTLPQGHPYIAPWIVYVGRKPF